jgi:hypothetical protein
MRYGLIRRPLRGYGRVGVGVLAAACIGVVGVSGCASEGSSSREDAGRQVAATARPETARPGKDASQAPSETAAAHGHEEPAAAVSAADLRGKLEQSLGQHAILTIRLTRARVRGDADLAQTADAALSKNTKDLGALIGSANGAPAEKFEQLWFRQVTTLFNHARAVSDKDQTLQAEARRQLDESTTNLSQFLEGASNKAIAAGDIRGELQKHVGQLLQQTDAYAAGDYSRAFAVERETYAQMFPLGKMLAAGLLSGRNGGLPADFDSPSRQLQLGLGRLLGEHAELAVDAMRSGISNAPDFSAAATALDGNTRDLTAAIEGVFGAPSAARFQTLWADHIDAFVSYTQARATKDPALETAAAARFKQFNTDFAAFLSTSTQQRLGAPALAEAFVMHEDLLLRQVNAFADRDYHTAHQLAYEAYQHMYVLAAQAATGIGATVAAQSPKGGAQTGAGGQAAVGPAR